MENKYIWAVFALAIIVGLSVYSAQITGEAVMKNAFGSVKVVANLRDANIYVDGSFKGRTNVRGIYYINNIYLGDHTLELTKPGYNRFSQKITILPGETIEVNAKLTGVGR